MTLHYSNTSLTSSVQLKPDSSSDSMLSGFSSNQNKKNGSCLNYLSTNSLQEFGDT